MSELDRLKTTAMAVPVDTTLDEGDGWHELKVRWLVTRELAGSETTVVGLSVFPPGAKHDLHRHPNAEEWEYVLSGSGIKRVGDVDVPIATGDIVFSPRDSYHGVANTSSETLTTIWGYTGVASLEEAGYVRPEDDGLTIEWPAPAGGD
jgi:oxalate decarboxylase/phosphoglucose isomerase-like protein (cupin superfamily)